MNYRTLHTLLDWSNFKLFQTFLNSFENAIARAWRPWGGETCLAPEQLPQRPSLVRHVAHAGRQGEALVALVDLVVVEVKAIESTTYYLRMRRGFQFRIKLILHQFCIVRLNRWYFKICSWWCVAESLLIFLDNVADIRKRVYFLKVH